MKAKMKSMMNTAKEKTVDATFANWKTTLAGLVAALSTYVIGHPGDFPEWMFQISQLSAVAGMAVMGIAGKDHSKTGTINSRTRRK